MEYIRGSDRHLIGYRGTLTIADGCESGPAFSITEDAYVRVRDGWTSEADWQCMLTVVNKLLMRAKRKIVSDLTIQFRARGSHDTTGTYPSRQEDGWLLIDRHVTHDTPRFYIVSLKAEKGLERLEARYRLEDFHQLDGSGALGRMGDFFYPDRVPQEIRARSEVRITQMPRYTHRFSPYGRPPADLMLRAIECIAHVDLSSIPPGPFVFDMQFRRERNTPKRRAMALLAMKIGKVRYRDLSKRGYFEEEGRHGTYRFHKDKQGGVTFIQKISVGGLKERTVSWELCVQSQAPDLPPGDVILSRWLEWKADEDRFLATANFRNITTVDEATERTGANGAEITAHIAGEPLHNRFVEITDQILRSISERTAIPLP